MKQKVKNLVKSLISKKLTIAFAESCTGGLLSSSITSVSGASKIFDMGLVTYSNTSKSKILGVSPRTIKTHGAVSYETCLEMVTNLYKISKSKICISITGVAGPKGGTKLKPVGLVFIGIKIDKKTIVKKFYFKKKGRNHIQNLTVDSVIVLINKFIKKNI